MEKSMNFRSADIEAITFAGITTRRQRKLFFRLQLALFILIACIIVFEARSLIDTGSKLLEVIGGLALVLLTYVLLWPRRRHQLAGLLEPYSLNAILDTRDAQIIQRAYNEVFRLSKGLNFADALKLREHEPAIGEFIHLKIMAHQRKGLLRRWLINQERLEQTCRFLYLCSVAEQRQADHLAGRESTVF